MPRKLNLTVADRRASDRVSNGTRIMPRGVIDGRSAAYRRYKALLHNYYADLGGIDQCSEGQKALVNAVVNMQLDLEVRASKFVERGATPHELDVYQRTASSLKRILEALGLHKGRKPRDVTPDDLSTYLASKSNGHARRTARVRVIDHGMEDEA
jgi:hypothetical protein